MARSGVGSPPEGCTCDGRFWHSDDASCLGSAGPRWCIDRTDPACPHHGTPPRDEMARRVREAIEGPATRGTVDDLFDGRMPREDDE